MDEYKVEFAKGNPNFSSGELNLIKGCQVTEVQQKLGSDKPKEAVEHRNIHLIGGEK
jgi:glutamate 5-kinase